MKPPYTLERFVEDGGLGGNRWEIRSYRKQCRWNTAMDAIYTDTRPWSHRPVPNPTDWRTLAEPLLPEATTYRQFLKACRREERTA